MESKKHGNPIAFLKWVAEYQDENGNYIELTGDRWHFSDKDDTDNVTEYQLWELYKLHNPDINEQAKTGAVWVKASDKLPLHRAFWNIEDGFKKDCSFPVRIDGEVYGMADLYDNRKEGAPDPIYYFVVKGDFGKEYYEDEFHRFEWLGESPATFNPELLQVMQDAEQSKEEDLKAVKEAIAGRGDWISVDERPLIKRDGEWWELTEDGEKEFIAAVPYHDAATGDPKKERWWIRHCFIDGEGFLYVKRDNEMDEDVAGWNVSDITHWKPLPEPPKFKQQKEK